MSAQLARLRTRTSDRVVIGSVSGEIDMSNAADLRNAIIAPLANESLGLVIDLSDVTYLDSAAIQIIYEVRDRLARRGQKLALVVVPDAPIMGALRVTGVLEILPVVATADEAEAAIR